MTRFSLNDSRRLTGANLYWDHPAAIIDVDIEDDNSPDTTRFLQAWDAAAKRLLEEVGHSGESLRTHRFRGGVSLLISAPIDALYSMCELNEMAFNHAAAALAGEPEPSLAEEAQRLGTLFEEESYPPVLEMQRAAAAHDVPFLWDDDEVSVGYGKSASVWAAKAVPPAGSVDWSVPKSIPVGLVTGTNGKSTSVRMAASMIRAAGLSAGLTSTDWIRVGDKLLDSGDYSGPGGARTLMRHPETAIAVLEVARGGLLRRGLGVERASAALITNVAADHLGEYGISTVAELAQAKFIVRRALKGDSPLILNADNAQSVETAAGLRDDFGERAARRIIWFSLDSDNAVIGRHLAQGGRVAILDEGWLVLQGPESRRAIVEASRIPATLGGAARHNISNALGAIALCGQLGIDDASLASGIAAFRGDESDNPGRGNWFEKDGVRILIDFAHNVHGMSALVNLVAAMESKRRVLLMGQAGDRSDNDIRDLTIGACRMKPDVLLLCDMPGYERGRAPMEVPRLIRSVALEQGTSPEAVRLFGSPAQATESALENAQAGDLLVLLALTQRDQVFDLVKEFTAG